jgi:hypothetical protein
MKLLPAAAVCLSFSQALFCQPTMPSWLANYPGATPQVKTFPALVEATYTTNAGPDLVTDHYRKLFEAQSLLFHPNSDGIGVTVRGAAAECDLLIAIRALDAGTFVRVSCAAKSQSATAISRQPPQDYQGKVADALERHHQLAAELGIHKVYADADAPPLIWPDWLVHIEGANLSIQQGVNPAGDHFLHSRFVTSKPMTAIFAFYKDLMTAHDYPVHSGVMTTGQTTSGIQQNANGHLEGSNFPNGSPGPWSVIHVSFSRFRLNDPITVDLKFTTFAYHAPKRQGF